MPINRTVMIDDDLTGMTGTVPNNAWLQELYGQIDAADATATADQPWITMPVGPMNWRLANGTAIAPTPVAPTNAYRFIGRTAVVWVGYFETINVPAATTYLQFTVPFTMNTARVFNVPIGQSHFPCRMGNLDATTMLVARSDGVALAVRADWLFLWSVVFEVVP
jgi:hypothetical protein